MTVILRQEPTSTQFPVEDVDFVIGDGSDLDTLRKAGAEQANAILGLINDDSENAFVVLAAKESKVKAKTVAAVNDAKHLNRIRHVHPDMIIAPQVLGDESMSRISWTASWGTPAANRNPVMAIDRFTIQCRSSNSL